MRVFKPISDSGLGPMKISATARLITPTGLSTSRRSANNMTNRVSDGGVRPVVDRGADWSSTTNAAASARFVAAADHIASDGTTTNPRNNVRDLLLIGNHLLNWRNDWVTERHTVHTVHARILDDAVRVGRNALVEL